MYFHDNSIIHNVGLIDDDSLIKLTCGYKASLHPDWKICNIPTEDKNGYFEKTSENEMRLKRTHKVYYQVSYSQSTVTLT